MKKCVIGAAAIIAGICGTAAAQTTIYNTEAAFNAVLAVGAYDEGFELVPFGAVPSLNFSGGSGPYSYTIDTPPGSISGLFNDTGLISTDNAGDAIRVTFTGAPVTAVGGIFFGSDISFAPVPAQVVITLSNGTIESFTTSLPTFRGFTTTLPILGFTIDAADLPGGPLAWPTIDRLVVGSFIPAPGAVALLGLGGLVATRRRR